LENAIDVSESTESGKYGLLLCLYSAKIHRLKHIYSVHIHVGAGSLLRRWQCINRCW